MHHAGRLRFGTGEYHCPLPHRMGPLQQRWTALGQCDWRAAPEVACPNGRPHFEVVSLSVLAVLGEGLVDWLAAWGLAGIDWGPCVGLNDSPEQGQPSGREDARMANDAQEAGTHRCWRDYRRGRAVVVLCGGTCWPKPKGKKEKRQPAQLGQPFPASSLSFSQQVQPRCSGSVSPFASSLP